MTEQKTADELQEHAEDLFRRVQQLKEHLDLAAQKARLEELEPELNNPALWDDPAKAQQVTRESATLRVRVESLEALDRAAADVREMLEMVAAEPDPALTSDLAGELDRLETDLGTRELDVLFSDPYAESAALVSLSSGAGGVDAQDWAEMLQQMYLKWAQRRGMKVEIVEVTPGEEAGIKGATMVITGERAYGWLKSERGIHRLVRLSPFDSAHRRHTSFARVEVVPELDEVTEAQIVIDDKDIRRDVFRSSGAGGQHVNKTSSAVRLTHLPTGLAVSVQNERSQHQNEEVALKILRSKLVALAQEQHLEHVQELKGEHVKAEWGSQIRSYVLQPYTQVKDHRTGFEVGNASGVLEDGDLDGLMEAYLRWEASGPHP
ncbi:MAG TPA: peptide chain release factor 2 [Candidatus Dormibacteraeota bacterium]|nr:peptide chain release factor 2 [Candidatus Dormibacteraeota bacterium]